MAGKVLRLGLSCRCPVPELLYVGCTSWKLLDDWQDLASVALSVWNMAYSTGQLQRDLHSATRKLGRGLPVLREIGNPKAL